MKSIDEFATEYAQDKYLPVQTSQAVKAGANYVLEQVEDVLTNPRRYVNSYKSVEEGMVDALIKCVEELKSNQ